MKLTNRSETLFITLVLFLLILSGFAQMPIFKRYYVADLPGLGWLAKFYVTHLIHYLFAAVLIGYATYAAIKKWLYKASGSAKKTTRVKWFALFLLIFTGIFMVIKNLSGTPFSHSFIIGLNLVHLMACLVLIASLVAGKVVRG
jgi:hypothetical protein